jgi:hypothetical protein
MRRLIPALTAVVLAIGGFATPLRAFRSIAIVQSASNFLSGSSSTIAFSGGTAGGNLVVVMNADMGTVSVTSVTDDKGSCSGYTQVPSSTTARSDAWYCNNVTAGATIITVNYSGSSASGGGVIYEISGQETSSVVDATNTASNSSSSSPNGAAVTTATANTIITTTIDGSGAVANVLGIHSGNAFTSDAINNSGTRGWGGAHLVASGTGAYTPQWDFSPSDTSLSTTVAWKQAGGGGGPTFPPALLSAPIRCCNLMWWFGHR